MRIRIISKIAGKHHFITSALMVAILPVVWVWVEGDDVVVAVDGEVCLPVNEVLVNLDARYQLVPHMLGKISKIKCMVVKVKRWIWLKQWIFTLQKWFDLPWKVWFCKFTLFFFTNGLTSLRLTTCLWKFRAGCRSRPQIHHTVKLQWGEGGGEDWLDFFAKVSPGRISGPVFPGCECMYFHELENPYRQTHTLLSSSFS